MTHSHDNVHYPNLDMVKVFVTKGTSVHYKNEHEKTPLHIAVRKENIPIIQYLVETVKADVNVLNGENSTDITRASDIDWDDM